MRIRNIIRSAKTRIVGTIVVAALAFGGLTGSALAVDYWNVVVPAGGNTFIADSINNTGYGGHYVSYGFDMDCLGTPGDTYQVGVYATHNSTWYVYPNATHAYNVNQGLFPIQTNPPAPYSRDQVYIFSYGSHAMNCTLQNFR